MRITQIGGGGGWSAQMRPSSSSSSSDKGRHVMSGRITRISGCCPARHAMLLINRGAPPPNTFLRTPGGRTSHGSPHSGRAQTRQRHGCQLQRGTDKTSVDTVTQRPGMFRRGRNRSTSCRHKCASSEPSISNTSPARTSEGDAECPRCPAALPTRR